MPMVAAISRRRTSGSLAIHRRARPWLVRNIQRAGSASPPAGLRTLLLVICIQCYPCPPAGRAIATEFHLPEETLRRRAESGTTPPEDRPVLRPRVARDPRRAVHGPGPPTIVVAGRREIFLPGRRNCR